MPLRGNPMPISGLQQGVTGFSGRSRQVVLGSKDHFISGSAGPAQNHFSDSPWWLKACFGNSAPNRHLCCWGVGKPHSLRQGLKTHNLRPSTTQAGHKYVCLAGQMFFLFSNLHTLEQREEFLIAPAYVVLYLAT